MGWRDERHYFSETAGSRAESTQNKRLLALRNAKNEANLH